MSRGENRDRPRFSPTPSRPRRKTWSVPDFGSDVKLRAMPLPFRLAANTWANFVTAGLFMAYFPLWLAWRGFDALEIAWVLALPQIMRTFAPAGWGALADRTGALRALVVLSCAGFALGFAALPFVEIFAAVLAGGAWLDVAPVAALPWAMLGFALATLVAAWSLPAGGARVHGEPVPWRLDGAAVRLLACGFCMAAAHGTLYAFFTLHLERSGYRVTTIGLLWTLGVVAEIVVFLCLPQLFRRFALSTILAASFGCAVVRFLLLGWLADVLWLV